MAVLALKTGLTLWASVIAFYNDLSTRYRDFLQARAERQRIFNELNSCTDRELAELGISRADIGAIADGTYQR
ncbi:MAG: DUF1127 domain-containing protein [Telmatospirillum sp.]|nr:DUF1127 domain-containing protein [Telmatospirillum sp.]